MSRFFLSKEHIRDGQITITGDDAHHICYSLRMAAGDEIIVCDMQKNEYRAVLQTLTGECVVARVLSTYPNDTELSVNVHLYQALPKGEKMELVVQKCTELGVSRIVPVQSSRCIVKLDDKNREKKRLRWERIAHEAAKQCGRGALPTVEQPVTLACALQQAPGWKLFCYEGDGTEGLRHVLAPRMQTDMPRDISVFIGPEGGFSPAEVEAAREQGAVLCGLGKRILRTESAALVVLSAIAYETEM